MPIDGVSKTRSTIRINVGQWLRSALKIRAPTTWDAKAGQLVIEYLLNRTDHTIFRPTGVPQ